MYMGLLLRQDRYQRFLQQDNRKPCSMLTQFSPLSEMYLLGSGPRLNSAFCVVPWPERTEHERTLKQRLQGIGKSEPDRVVRVINVNNPVVPDACKLCWTCAPCFLSPDIVSFQGGNLIFHTHQDSQRWPICNFSYVHCVIATSSGLFLCVHKLVLIRL